MLGGHSTIATPHLQDGSQVCSFWLWILSLLKPPLKIRTDSSLLNLKSHNVYRAHQMTNILKQRYELMQDKLKYINAGLLEAALSPCVCERNRERGRRRGETERERGEGEEREKGKPMSGL